jgi:hypothetical protein
MPNSKLLIAPLLHSHIENIIPVQVKVDVATELQSLIKLVMLRVETTDGSSTSSYDLSSMPTSGLARFEIESALQFCFEKFTQQTVSTEHAAIFKEEGYVLKYRLYATLYTVSGAYDTEEILSSGTINLWYAYRAGLSDTVFASGFNVFTDKHFSSAANYFLTSRTASQALTVRENEQRRFWFLSRNNETFKLTNIYNQSITVEYANTEVACLALDLDQIRSQFYYTYGHLPNVIDIERTGFAKITFAIVPSLPSKKIRVLEFTNAWEVKDKVELTGDMELNATSDDEAYDRYYPASGGFYKSINRSSSDQSLTGSVGYKTPAELMWISDMLSSPEVFLIENGSKFPVVVKRDSHVIASDSFVPGSISIEINFSIKNNRYTPV